MKIVTSYFRTPKTDVGSSLIEVIVASLIMSLIGLALVTVTVGAKPLAARFNSKSVALSSLTFAAKQIQLQPIQDTNCSASAKIQPYYFGTIPAKGGIGFVLSVVQDFKPVLASPATGYTYSVTPNLLPAGLSIDAATGVISGTPVSEGSFTYTIVATKGTSVSKQVVNISIISVVVKIDVASATTTTDFQSCATNSAGISTATAAYTTKQIIQEVVLSTTTDSTQTTRTIVKMG